MRRIRFHCTRRHRAVVATLCRLGASGPVQAHERAKTPRANHRHLAGHQYNTDAKNAPRGSEYRPIVIRFIT